MFRYSLVYGVRDIHHPLCDVIKSYASVLKTTAFSPRITIRHSLSFETAVSLHRLFRAEYNLPKIDFVDEVSVSCSMLFKQWLHLQHVCCKWQARVVLQFGAACAVERSARPGFARFVGLQSWYTIYTLGA